MGVVLLTALFIAGPVHGQVAISDDKLATVTGKITYSDPESDTISVQTDQGTSMTFHIMLESDLLNFTRHMSIIELQKGDPVTVQYSNRSGLNVVTRLVDTKPLT